MATPKEIEQVQEVVDEYFDEAYKALLRGSIETAISMIERAVENCKGLEWRLEEAWKQTM